MGDIGTEKETIILEPLEVPGIPAPAELPAAPEREHEAEPAREPEKVPA